MRALPGFSNMDKIFLIGQKNKCFFFDIFAH